MGMMLATVNGKRASRSKRDAPGVNIRYAWRRRVGTGSSTGREQRRGEEVREGFVSFGRLSSDGIIISFVRREGYSHRKTTRRRGRGRREVYERSGKDEIVH